MDSRSIGFAEGKLPEKRDGLDINKGNNEAKT